MVVGGEVPTTDYRLRPNLQRLVDAVAVYQTSKALARVGLSVSLPSPGSVIDLLRQGPNAALHFFGDRLRRSGSDVDLAPGEGAIVDSRLGKTAVYRDDEGKVHELSARGPHLGCLVDWNAAEGSWDCPCHGSRFSPSGEVWRGPARAPLAPKASSSRAR